MARAPYSSIRRAAAAAETREAILVSARRLFAARGYGAVTVADIAKAAQVAVPTVYASAGNKAQILRELIGLAENAPGVDAMVREMAHETDPEAVIGIAVAVSRQINEKYFDVLRVIAQAAPAFEEAAAAWASGLAAARQACERTASLLARRHVLAAGISKSAAGNSLTVLLHPRTWLTLVEQLGWSWERAEEWQRRAACRLILASESDPRSE